MLELPALLIGLWCSPVRWELRSDFLTYSRAICFSGDNFLSIEPGKISGPRVSCQVTKVARLGNKRWVSSGEMAFSAWGNCADGTTTWEQKITFLENGYVKVLSDWVLYAPGYTGPTRTLIRW